MSILFFNFVIFKFLQEVLTGQFLRGGGGGGGVQAYNFGNFDSEI